MTMHVTARCHCEQIQFESDDPPLLQFVCHCADCRAASKEDFTTTAFFLASTTSVTGKMSELQFTADCGARTTREFCANCGTFMFDKSARFPTLVGVVARTLDPPFVPEPSCHVWIRSKQPTVVVSDDLPYHDGDFG